MSDDALASLWVILIVVLLLIGRCGGEPKPRKRAR
jgi:hypothetical protein